MKMFETLGKILDQDYCASIRCAYLTHRDEMGRMYILKVGYTLDDFIEFMKRLESDGLYQWHLRGNIWFSDDSWLEYDEDADPDDEWLHQYWKLYRMPEIPSVCG